MTAGQKGSFSMGGPGSGKRKAAAAPAIEYLDAAGKPIGPDDATGATIEEDIARQFEEIKSEFQQSETDVTWEIVVTKVSGPNYRPGKSEPYCFTCDVAELGGIRDRIRDGWGPGAYRIRVRKNKQNYRQWDYAIAEGVKSALPQTTENVVVKALLDRMTRLEDILAEAANRQPKDIPPPVDPFSTIERTVTLLTPLLANRPAAAADPTQSFTAALELANKLNELRGSADTGAAETNWMDLAKAALETPLAAQVLRAVAPQVFQRANAQAAPPAQASPPAPAIAKPLPSGATGEQNNQVAQLGRNVQYLLTRARRHPLESERGDDAITLYAEWCFDNFAPPIIEAARYDPEFLNTLVQRFPQVAAVRPWFEALVAEIKFQAENEGIEAGEDAERDPKDLPDDAARRAGDGVHAQRNGQAREPGEEVGAGETLHSGADLAAASESVLS